jgi:hypothetical protein
MSRIETSEMGFLQVVQHSNTGRPVSPVGRGQLRARTILARFHAPPPSASMTGQCLGAAQPGKISLFI